MSRPEFFTLTLPEKVAFYVLVFASIGLMFWQIWQRSALWRQGKPIAPLREGLKYWLPSKAGLARWVGNFTKYVLAQRKVRSSRKKTGAPMHVFIFYGFLALFLATTLLALATYAPLVGIPNWHRGDYYIWYELIFDVLGLFFVIGVAWALIRRYVDERRELGAATLRSADEAQAAKQAVDKRRKPLSSAMSDYWALGILLMLGLTGYWLESARLSVGMSGLTAGSELAKHLGISPVGGMIASLVGPMDLSIYRYIWWFHFIWVFAFFATLPRMRIRHIAMAILSTAGKPDRPMGHLLPISMEEVEETGQIGVASAKDYSRWHLMSLDACMECGRCTEVCPAWSVGKVLNPKQVVQDVRDAMVTGASVPATISEEALWACTTCNACVEACPVLIRHVDLIVDARRNLVAEGQLAGSAAVMLRQTASTGNAWGTPASNREDWMKGLDIPLCRDGGEFEFLFWVGCAGATDPGAVKTTKAVADLLKKAGVKFACLGQEEACTGDPARRVGEEFLFQEKAMSNASTFERYGVKKVVTACPHCFNTLKNEYGEFGAQMEVYHHTQLLAELISKSKLKSATPGRGSVVMHDPCYLARVNDESDAPRLLLGAETSLNGRSPDGLGGAGASSHDLVEAKFYASKTRCCGAGGGRMWMEEAPDQRPGNARAEQLLETGAKTVAVACPFCRIMLDASIKQVSQEDIRLVDLAELLSEANA